MANILTLSGAGDGIGRTSPTKAKKAGPTANLKVGECICALNTRTGDGVSVCRVPPGQTRNNLKLGGKCPNPIKTK